MGLSTSLALHGWGSAGMPRFCFSRTHPVALGKPAFGAFVSSFVKWESNYAIMMRL